MLELQALGVVHGHHAHPARLAIAGRLLLAQPGLGDRGDVASELPWSGLGRTPHVGRGHLAELGEVDQTLDDVGLRGEQLLAAQAEALDQAVHEQIGPGRVQGRRGGAVALEELEDPLARLGRDLRRFGGGHQRRDHVELAPARDLDAPGEVDRSQLHGRAGERAHDGAGVARVGQQAQPGQDVANLRALEEGRRAEQAVRYGALVQGHRDRLALAADGAHEHAHGLRRDAAGEQRLDVGGDALRLGALVVAAPERHLTALAPGRSRLELGHRLDDGPRRGQDRRPQRRLRSSRTTRGAGRSSIMACTFAPAAARKRWIAWSGSAAATRVASPPASSRATDAGPRSSSSSSSRRTWSNRARSRALASDPSASRACARSTRSPVSSIPMSFNRASCAR